MAAGRHKSVSASLAYQRRSGQSKAAKFDAVKRAMKHGLDDDIESLLPEKKKMKSANESKAGLKLYSDGEGGEEEDRHDEDAKDKALSAVPSAKADSSSSFPLGKDGGSGTKPVSFTFHFS